VWLCEVCLARREGIRSTHDSYVFGIGKIFLPAFPVENCPEPISPLVSQHHSFLHQHNPNVAPWNNCLNRNLIRMYRQVVSSVDLT
jgi:hypothetical protein